MFVIRLLFLSIEHLPALLLLHILVRWRLVENNSDRFITVLCLSYFLLSCHSGNATLSSSRTHEHNNKHHVVLFSLTHSLHLQFRGKLCNHSNTRPLIATLNTTHSYLSYSSSPPLVTAYFYTIFLFCGQFCEQLKPQTITGE